MAKQKQFRLDVFPRDVLADVHDLDANAGFAYLKFWMHHALHGEPLPPRDVKKPRAEWDEWFRDLLGMKNVRTWRNARDELLKLGKIRQADDGRLYIGRTMRDAERKRGGDPLKWSDDDRQGKLCLEGMHCAQRRVEKPVGDPVSISDSPEVRPNIAQTSPDVRPIRLPNPLILRGSRAALSYSQSKSHEVVAVISTVAARARGDPAAFRA